MLTIGKGGSQAHTRRLANFEKAFRQAIEHKDSVSIGYAGERRTVMPLAVTQGRDGQTLLKGVRSDGGGFRCYRLDRIESESVNHETPPEDVVLKALEGGIARGTALHLRYRTANDFVMELDVAPRALTQTRDKHTLLECERQDTHQVRHLRVDRIQQASSNNPTALAVFD